MRQYECLLFLSPELTDDLLNKELASIEEIIKTHGGTVQHKSFPKKTELGYTIHKRREAQCVVLDATMPADQVKDIEKVLRLKETLLRFMITVKQAVKTAL